MKEERKKERDLEVDVGAVAELMGEVGITENVLPLTGAVPFNSGAQRLLFFPRPF